MLSLMLCLPYSLTYSLQVESEEYTKSRFVAMVIDGDTSISFSSEEIGVFTKHISPYFDKKSN
jgi:hypothetical protein